jgi:hypothetical protein
MYMKHLSSLRLKALILISISIFSYPNLSYASNIQSQFQNSFSLIKDGFSSIFNFSKPNKAQILTVLTPTPTPQPSIQIASATLPIPKKTIPTPTPTKVPTPTISSTFTSSQVSYIKSLFSQLLAENNSNNSSISSLTQELNNLKTLVSRTIPQEQPTWKGTGNSTPSLGSSDSSITANSLTTGTVNVTNTLTANNATVSNLLTVS